MFLKKLYKGVFVEKAEKKIEAIKRMRMLELHRTCIEAFESKDEIWLSEGDGILFDLSQRPALLQQIREIEKDYDLFVYHGILTHTEFGTLISLFYVSDEQDEWQLDYDDMKDNYACVYVLNLDDDICSEIGSIQYEKINGGLKRIA